MSNLGDQFGLRQRWPTGRSWGWREAPSQLEPNDSLRPSFRRDNPVLGWPSSGSSGKMATFPSARIGCALSGSMRVLRLSSADSGSCRPSLGSNTKPAGGRLNRTGAHTSPLWFKNSGFRPNWSTFFAGGTIIAQTGQQSHLEPSFTLSGFGSSMAGHGRWWRRELIRTRLRWRLGPQPEVCSLSSAEAAPDAPRANFSIR